MKVGRISVIHLGLEANVMDGRPRGDDVRGPGRNDVGRGDDGYLW